MQPTGIGNTSREQVIESTVGHDLNAYPIMHMYIFPTLVFLLNRMLQMRLCTAAALSSLHIQSNCLD
jgi:hypothetical protein